MNSFITAMDGYNLPYDICDFKEGEALLRTELDFHLVFLDIMMEGVSGMEVDREVRSLRVWDKLKIKNNKES